MFWPMRWARLVASSSTAGFQALIRPLRRGTLRGPPPDEALLADPAVIQATQNGDYASLLGNAKIQVLENNAKLTQLLKQRQ